MRYTQIDIDNMLKTPQGQASLQRYAERLAKQASREMNITLEKMTRLLNKIS